MATEIKPIRTEKDHKAALQEIERLWDAKLGTPSGDRLEVLTTLVHAYEEKLYPIRSARPDRCDQVPPGADGPY